MLVFNAPTPVADAAWTPVLGAQVLFDPINRAMLRCARRAALEAMGRDDDGGERPASEQLEELGDALSHELILAGARDWKDVGQQRLDPNGPVVDGDGAPVFEAVPFSRENLTAVLADPIAFEAFDAAYVLPFATRERERAAPGNGFAASPSGTGEAAMRAPDTAASPAEPSSGDDALPALTASTKPQRTRKRMSGAS